MRTLFARLLAKADMRRICIHDLRHTYSTPRGSVLRLLHSLDDHADNVRRFRDSQVDFPS